MDKFDRIFKLHNILSNRHTVIGMEDLRARLECGRSTLFRIIGELKNNLCAPVVYDSTQRGWRYEKTAESGMFELPGLWLSAAGRT